MEGIIALLWLVAAILGIVQFIAVLQLFGIRKDLRLLTEHLVSGSKGKQTVGKNEHSMVPIPMHPALAAYLKQWREQSLYNRDSDWMFPSLKLKGTKPRVASIAAQDYLRPAAVKAGVIEEGSSKRFGWHNLRHSLATFLAGQVDSSVVMKTLRHKRLATTMEIYSHRVNSTQMDAQGLYLEAIKKAKPATEAVQ
jgi:integrase